MPGICRDVMPSGPYHAGPRLSTALASALVLLAIPPAAGIYFRQQQITSNTTKYCGFYDLQRYKAWCTDAYISAFVASNSSCQQYGVCAPLEGSETLSCSNATFCSRARTDSSSSGSSSGSSAASVPACLVLQTVQNGTTATCDVEVIGHSTYDPSPPPPSPPAPPSSQPAAGWALWKSMAIIWSILGAAALLVITVFAIRWCVRRRSEASRTAPITFLTDLAKLQLETLQQQQQGHTAEKQQQLNIATAMMVYKSQQQHTYWTSPGGLGTLPAMPYNGPADMTVALRKVSPDGKPILAYGASHPPQPSFDFYTASSSFGGGFGFAGGGFPGSTSHQAASRQLPPTAGDALLQAAAASRAAHNGAPRRSPPPPAVPPPLGTVVPPAPAQAAASAFSGSGGALLPYNGREPRVEPQQSEWENYGVGADPAVVTPAALVPPAATTLGSR